MADALLDVAVRAERVDVVVERAGPGGRVRVEQAALAAGGHGHAHRVGQALAERPGGGLHPRGEAVLGVARGHAAPGPVAPRGRPGSGRSRTGRAGCTGSGWSARRTARTGPGRASPGRPGRAGGCAGRAGRRRGPGSSPCPGGRLPTCCTASMARTRIRSTARWSAAVQSKVLVVGLLTVGSGLLSGPRRPAGRARELDHVHDPIPSFAYSRGTPERGNSGWITVPPVRSQAWRPTPASTRAP